MEELLGPVPFWAWLALTLLNYALIGVLILRIVQQRRSPPSTLAWVFFVLLVPYLGLLAFWLLGRNRLRLRRWRRRKQKAPVSKRLVVLAGGDPARAAVLPDSAGPNQQLEAKPAASRPFPGDPGLARAAARLGCAEATPHNAVEILWEGRRTFARLEEAIDAARHHVHLLFYIWTPDATGTHLRERLEAAARRGVEVRLLVDDVGSLKAPARWFRPLVQAGGRVERFLPVSLFSRRITLNNRNHRKIVVVDGRVGFTGGCNVGDAYAGLDPTWRDAHARLEGPAVRRLQEVFAQDWYHTTEEDLAHASYFPPNETEPPGDEWVQILSSGPTKRALQPIHTLFFAAISLARERVWIGTPYFAPDAATILALQAAALRGVDVRLLLPRKSDHPLAVVVARSYYDRLLSAGVAIRELPELFLHAKVGTVDGALSTVGSANMDVRSFRLNFEANAIFYGARLAGEIDETLTRLWEQAEPIEPGPWGRRPRLQRLAESLAHLLTPLA